MKGPKSAIFNWWDLSDNSIDSLYKISFSFVSMTERWKAHTNKWVHVQFPVTTYLKDILSRNTKKQAVTELLINRVCQLTLL